MKIDIVHRIKALIKNYPKISFVVLMLFLLAGAFVFGQQYEKYKNVDNVSVSIEDNKINSKDPEVINEFAKQNEEKTISKNDAVEIKLLKRDFVKSGYSEYLYFEFQYKNKTQKTIKAFKGSVMFYDVFGEMLLSVGIEHLEPIKAGETITEEGNWDYNQFMTDNVKFMNQPHEDTAYKVKINEVLYLDEPEEENLEEDSINEDSE